MKRIPRRLSTEEFKREAIKLITEQNLNVAQAGPQLDIDPESIRAWMVQAERGELKSTLGATKLTADQQRIRELELERELQPPVELTVAFFKMSRFSRAIASSRSSSRIRCWSAVSLDAPSVALSSPR